MATSFAPTTTPRPVRREEKLVLLAVDMVSQLLLLLLLLTELLLDSEDIVDAEEDIAGIIRRWRVLLKVPEEEWWDIDLLLMFSDDLGFG